MCLLFPRFPLCALTFSEPWTIGRRNSMASPLKVDENEIQVQTGCRFPLIDHSLTYGRSVIARMLLEASPFETVVDLGAGIGEDLASARKTCPNAATFAVECREESKRILAANGHQVVSLNLERDSLPFNDESVDVFIMNQVLEHIKEIFWVFHEVARCLRVGKYLIIGVPNLACLHNRFLLAIGKQPTQLKNYSAHVRGFTRADILAFFRETCGGNFRIRRFAGSQFYPFPSPIAKILARCLPSMAFSIFFLVQKVAEYSNSFQRYPVIRGLETNFYLGDVTVEVGTRHSQ
jgi:SAM-dependent methyltransferase